MSRTAGSTRRVSKPAVVGAMAAAGLLGLLAASRPWVTATVDGLIRQGAVSVTGREASPVVAGLSLVVLAAAVLVGVGGPRMRAFALFAGAASGAAMLVSALLFRTHPSGSLAEQVREVTGTTGGTETIARAEVSAWPWAVVAAGLVLLVSCVAGWLSRRAWRVGSRRFEREPAGEQAAAGGGVGFDREDTADSGAAHQVDALDAWQALSRGDDPTLAG